MTAAYDRIGPGYTNHRRPDPRIAALIDGALGDVRSIVNVGAGAGAYEPSDRQVIAVEPSREMIAQRPTGSAPVVVAAAENLPLADNTVEAAMTVLSIHHWTDWRAGVAEMRRVARDRIVILTWDPEGGGFWLTEEYLGWLMEWDATRFDPIAELVGELPGATVTPVPIPADCSDGFFAAYWARPERYLDPEVRAAMSVYSQAPDPERVDTSLARLEADLASGSWDERHGNLRAARELDAGYRLVVAGV
jgi:SAM-dependent methyltransferase